MNIICSYSEIYVIFGTNFIQNFKKIAKFKKDTIANLKKPKEKSTMIITEDWTARTSSKTVRNLQECVCCITEISGLPRSNKILWAFRSLSFAFHDAFYYFSSNITIVIDIYFPGKLCTPK